MISNSDSQENPSYIPPDNNSENLSGRDVTSDNPDNSTPVIKEENMEVHHHPKVEIKSFKEYLLEGLMIFVAVTMGFFAENIREHFSDKKNEKQIIIALKKDLVRGCKTNCVKG